MPIAHEIARLQSILDQLPLPHMTLELGCGDRPEALLYYTTFPDIFLLGIDHDAAALHTIRNPLIHLIQADITHLPFGAQFDLIVARHPDVDRHATAWQQALAHIPNFLDKGGYLLVTTYSLPEMERVKGWIASMALISLSIPAERLAPPGLQGCDRYIGCWRNF